MSGASAGGHLFPGSWSWEKPKRTGGTIMQRQGTARLPIERVFWEVHDAVLNALQSRLIPRLNDRYQSTMLRELNRELQGAA